MTTGAIRSMQDLLTIKAEYIAELNRYSHQILVCGGAGCVSSGCAGIVQAIHESLDEHNLTQEVKVMETGCMGTCAVGPAILVLPERIFYTNLNPERVRSIIKAHLVAGVILERFTFYDAALDEHIPKLDDIDFFRNQVKIVLRNCGEMDHADINAYVARDGYAAAARCLTEKSPEYVVGEVKKSGIRGRGGAGFPTGVKWEAGRTAPGDTKYIVCNADEGDPGAFMDRSVIEGDPHSLLEGMILGGYAIGAHTGFVYIRAEYPLAIERLEKAIAQAREAGLLGKDIFGSGFDFDVEIRIGAGAFVCGEETALMNSIEGRRGEPRQKPPFPFQSGLFGCPTIINNVETLANIAAILQNGGEWYASYGTAASKGTKVFALAGDIVNTGLVEVPIGTTLGTILFDIGGGIPSGKEFKAGQIGGPSGGCFTSKDLNTPADYETMKKLGAIMGSGGFIAMNDDTCMVDTARYFMDFIQDESCGQCVACRIGTKRMLEILERICVGQGKPDDIAKLELLGRTVQLSSMCNLGQTAPNPVLSAIKNFREEFEEHIFQHHCRAGVCTDLVMAPCQNTCPASINVPGYTALVAEGRFVDAYRLIMRENPFPAVCGRICTRPCESKCRRSTLDEAVAICDIKRFASDYAFSHEDPFMSEPMAPRNGKRVAVIGAGVAGLTCGHYLTRIGYDVDVYEAEKVAGGTLALAIPEYRLPMSVLNHEISIIEKGGVRIHLNTKVGEDISFETLRDHSDAIFIGVGTQAPRHIGIEGEDLDGVIPGVTFLKSVNLKQLVKLGKRVAIIGGGNTAVDASRTALRLGADEVTILYRRTRKEMPALKREIEEAVEEGIKIVEHVQPVRIVGDADGHVAGIECLRTVLGEFGPDARKLPVDVEKSEFILDVDTIIPAVSQDADIAFAEVEPPNVTHWGTLAVDTDTMMTSVEGVFAGGDAVHGSDIAIQAIADGKKAAIAIDKYLGGSGVLNKGPEIEIDMVYDNDEVVELKRYPVTVLDLEHRCNSFDEVLLGYPKSTAVAEAMRCLHCERR